ncbi:Tetraspanin-7 [Tyrophagus putrescentiae]|nr:Tetraspanin-7 [Tyrophagus putrescentiae]
MQELNRRRFQTKACIAASRTFLMLFNVIFWIVGFILLMMGFWMRASIGKIFKIVPELNFSLPTLLLITGTSMMVIGVVACFCTSTESSVLLYILSTVFFLIFGLILATSITGYVYRDMLKTQLHHSLNETIQEYGNGSLVEKDWDRVQNTFACCGVDNYEDWSRSKWHTAHANLSYPDSCCRSLKFCDNISVEQIYKDGCYPTILNALTDNFTSIGLVTFFISLFQLCGVTLAICLGNHISKAHYEEIY